MAKTCKKLEVRESTVRHDGLGADGVNGGGLGGLIDECSIVLSIQSSITETLVNNRVNQ